MAKGFRLDISKLANGLIGAQDKADLAIRMYAEQGARQLEKKKPPLDRPNWARPAETQRICRKV